MYRFSDFMKGARTKLVGQGIITPSVLCGQHLALCTEDRLTFVPVAQATSCWSVRAVHTIFVRNARSLLTMRVSTAFVTFVACRPQFAYFVRTRPQRRDKAP